MDNFVFGVTQLNEYIKDLMECDIGLRSLFVRGEISNYKAYPSGHHYFSLKDEGGTLRCVLFKRDAATLRFRPENGMKVLALGRVTVFPRDGQYQLYCNELTPDGVGDLHMAFEQQKAQLQQEGLFDLAQKKPLPQYPEKIALITSPAGAAVRDMLRILEARWPMAQVCILPVRVQGTEAAGEISRALDFANAHHVADVIIMGRGGGSMEDLWAFNETVVARAIYRSIIPVISAVGHEPDVTIADFVADLRAATPSNAAELAVPDQNEVAATLLQQKIRVGQQMKRRLERVRERLERLGASRSLMSPMNPLADRRMLLDHQTHRLVTSLQQSVAKERARFATCAAKLDALSPLKVLGRGYAIPQKEGQVITTTASLKPGDHITLRLQDGQVPCEVMKG